MAELHSLGTLGLEEREGEILAYFPGELSPGVAAGVRALANPAAGVHVAAADRVAERDWEAVWRVGLAPRRVATIWIRPSWCVSAGTPEIVIDPKQAFGSGEHASTRCALRLALGALRPGDTVYDFGCGSGIVGLAALRLGAARAVGVEVDPVACLNAAENRAENALGLELVCGRGDALEPGLGFDVVVANMIWQSLGSELIALVRHARRDLVLSGYLEAERAEVERAVASAGCEIVERTAEPQSGDEWCALRAQPRPRQLSRRSSSVVSQS